MSTSKMSSARSVFYAVALCAFGISIPACSCTSETVPTVPDTGVRPDGAMPDANVDTGPRPDTGPDTGPRPDGGPDAGPVCGDGILDASEECDDSNTTPNDGCSATCTFECGDGAVTGTETCDTGIAAGTTGACPATCDDGMVCTMDMLNGSACTTTCTHADIAAGPADSCCPTGATPATDPDCSASCGNGFVDSGETCDTAITSGVGSCPATCDDGVACTADAATGSACTAACTHTSITTPSGTTSDGCCPAGATSGTDTDCSAACGNGFVDAGETCDTGITSGAGSCPATCNDSMVCTTDMLVGAGTCTAACSFTPITTAMSGDGCCPAGANHNTDTDCAAMCGNGVVEGPGETCDPPAAGTCSATCTTIVSACGNGTLDAGEDCDDGNLRNLDGCNSGCRYESFSRLTDLQISGMRGPAACTPRTNQLGRVALTNTARGQLNPTLRTDVVNGTLNVLIQALGLTDLTGVTNPSFQLGVMNGAPDPAAGTWPAAGNPIDWRFFIDHNTVATTGLPTALMPATDAARVLTAGPADIIIPVNLAGSIATLSLLSTHVLGTIGAMTSHPPYPASLRASINTFTDISGNTDGTNGLCGNVSVTSLAQIPAPMALTSGGTACSRGYTYCGAGMGVHAGCNSLLDVIVGGCTVFIITAINPTQPDVAGAGTVRTLSLGAGNAVPASQLAGNVDAYSSYFLFTANRAHASGESCTAASQCQSGQACTGGVCI